MKLPAYSRYDWLIQLIVLPLYIGICNSILIGQPYWHNRTTFLAASGIILIISYGNWYVNNTISLALERRYPAQSQYMARMVLQFLACSVSSCFVITLPYVLYKWLALPGFEQSPFRLALMWLFTVIVVAIVVAVYEGIHNYDHLQQSRQKVDSLSKAQLQAQLDALRQQVNPHFLFNSLNSLTALISEDPQQAETFAEELSSVYRYLLRSNESPLTPLANELEFVNSYYHLLKTRHGEALTLVTSIQPGAETRQLPPLTLQLLIENAVKHNVILPEQPLTIALTTNEQQHLVVSNNLQRKPSRTLSNGVGLSNILTKYQMLGQPAPVIEDDGREFRVTLPLV